MERREVMDRIDWTVRMVRMMIQKVMDRREGMGIAKSVIVLPKKRALKKSVP